MYKIVCICGFERETKMGDREREEGQRRANTRRTLTSCFRNQSHIKRLKAYGPSYILYLIFT